MYYINRFKQNRLVLAFSSPLMKSNVHKLISESFTTKLLSLNSWLSIKWKLQNISSFFASKICNSCSSCFIITGISDTELHTTADSFPFFPTKHKIEIAELSWFSTWQFLQEFFNSFAQSCMYRTEHLHLYPELQKLQTLVTWAKWNYYFVF